MYRLTKMKTYNFDKIIESVEEMSDDEQLTLVELIAHRITERRRDEIAINIMGANEDYANGQVFRGSVADVMAELER
jgi:hypothetical protein